MALNLTLPTGFRTIEQGFVVDLQPELFAYEFMGWSIPDHPDTWLCSKTKFDIPAGIGDVLVVALFDELIR
jgi:hypothetical protein